MRLIIKNTDGRMGAGVSSISYTSSEDGSVSRKVNRTAETKKRTPDKTAASSHSAPARLDFSGMTDNQLEIAKNRAAVDLDTDTMNRISAEQKARSDVRKRVPDWTYGLTGTERRERREELDRLNRQVLDPAVHQNPTRMNQVNERIKNFRAEIGEQTFFDRVDDTWLVGAGRYATKMANIVGTVAKVFQNPDTVRQRVDNSKKVLEAGAYADGTHLTPEYQRDLEDFIAREEKRLQKLESPGRFANKALGLVDEMSTRVDEAYWRATEGLGPLGKLAVDTGAEGIEAGLDALLGSVTGSSPKSVLAARTFGESAMEARQAGGSVGQQLAYGTGSAALSIGTEMIFSLSSSLEKMFGKNVAEKIVGTFVKQFGSTQAVRLMTKLSNSTNGRILLSAIGEASEGVAKDTLQLFLRRLIYDPDAEFDIEEAIRDFKTNALIGGLISGVGEYPKWRSDEDIANELLGKLLDNAVLPEIKQGGKDSSLQMNYYQNSAKTFDTDLNNATDFQKLFRFYEQKLRGNND